VLHTVNFLRNSEQNSLKIQTYVTNALPSVWTRNVLITLENNKAKRWKIIQQGLLFVTIYIYIRKVLFIVSLRSADILFWDIFFAVSLSLYSNESLLFEVHEDQMQPKF
jgi:hypothetical protein